jgi:hypothetical protein
MSLLPEPLDHGYSPYEGNFKDGLYSCSGTLSWTNGNAYEGNFENGLSMAT